MWVVVPCRLGSWRCHRPRHLSEESSEKEPSSRPRASKGCTHRRRRCRQAASSLGASFQVLWRQQGRHRRFRARSSHGFCRTVSD